MKPKKVFNLQHLKRFPNESPLIGNLLRCLIGESPRNWESIIPLIEFSYNSSLNHTIKTSHFQVVCGNKSLRMSDLGPFPLSKESVRATKMIKFMQSIHAQIKERIEYSLIFKEGDLIWVILTKERCPHGSYYKWVYAKC